MTEIGLKQGDVVGVWFVLLSSLRLRILNKYAIQGERRAIRRHCSNYGTDRSWFRPTGNCHLVFRSVTVVH
jgi:hypothetical protein